MTIQDLLIRYCLSAYRKANQPGSRDRHSLGDEIIWTDSPSRLAGILKARLLTASSVNVSWLGLAIAILEARAHA